MESILPVLKTVNICFACSNDYVEHLATAIYSLVYNANKFRTYDILILHSNITTDSMNVVMRIVEKYPNFSIRFIDVSEYQHLMQYEVGAYYSIETNYRLLLLSEPFNQYDKIIYLDSDTVVNADICNLFDMDISNYYVGAVKDSIIRYYQHSKRAIHYNKGHLYNINTYRTKFLNLKYPESYFNAGVLLINLKECRKDIPFQRVVDTLHGEDYVYNDQDVLNILFNSKCMLLDISWNYMNNVEEFYNSRIEEYVNLYSDLKRNDYNIIHYIGQLKPWNSKVRLDEYYHKYYKLMESL